MEDGHDAITALLRDVPDFPRPGIRFRDLTPVLADAAGLRALVDGLAAALEGSAPDAVAGIEARGFVLAAPVALALGVGFVPLRKPGKLPWRTASITYDLEYGTDSLEVHVDATGSGRRIAVVDDVLATGGTAAAACALLEGLGAEVVGVAVALELAGLGGRDRLPAHPVHPLATIGLDEPAGAVPAAAAPVEG